VKANVFVEDRKIYNVSCGHQECQEAESQKNGLP